MRRSHKYCDHNKVVKSYADGGKVEKDKKPKKKEKGKEMKGGLLGNAKRELKNRRRKQMEDLGID